MTVAHNESGLSVPQATPDSQPFWSACVDHELRIQRCQRCTRFWFPPGNRCQYCWSEEFAWQPASGRGQVYSYTVYRRAYSADLAGKVPYVVAVVELDEGPRMVTNVVGCPPEAVRIGMSVDAVFESIGPGVTLPRFRPRDHVRSPSTPTPTSPVPVGDAGGRR